MRTKNINFHNNFFSFVLVPIIIVIGIISYNRFMVRHDYLVWYEGVCDPATEQCFIGCEDDACTTEYYYSQVVKYAPDLYNECGSDITGCESASVCLPSDQKCSVTYCNPEIDGDVCTTIEETNTVSDDTGIDELLQDNNTSDTNI